MKSIVLWNGGLSKGKIYKIACEIQLLLVVPLKGKTADSNDIYD